MTIVQRCRVSQSAWTEWPDPPRATLRATVWCAGRTTSLVDDLCSALADKLDWGEYGVTIFPESTLPLDTPDGGEARLEIGSLVGVTDVNQPSPEFEDGSPNPSVSEVRIRLEQPISNDLADRAELLKRRDDILDVLSRIYGRIHLVIRETKPPRPVTGRTFSAAFSGSFA